MSETSIQDFIAVVNVTITGLEQLGSFGLSLTKGTAKTAARMITVAKWVGKHMTKENKTGGKVKNQTIAKKFKDLRFSEMPLFAPQEIYRQLTELYPGQYDPKKIEKYLSPDVLQKEFDKLAEKHGLLYARVPNFIPDKHTCIVEYRFAYSNSQTDAKEATLEQMQAYISRQLEKCGVKKEAAKQFAKKTDTTKDMPFADSLAHIDAEKVSEEQYHNAMLITYPDYLPDVIELSEPSESQKALYSRMIGVSEPSNAALPAPKEQRQQTHQHQPKQLNGPVIGLPKKNSK